MTEHEIEKNLRRFIGGVLKIASSEIYEGEIEDFKDFSVVDEGGKKIVRIRLKFSTLVRNPYKVAGHVKCDSTETGYETDVEFVVGDKIETDDYDSCTVKSESGGGEILKFFQPNGPHHFFYQTMWMELSREKAA